MRHDRRTPVHIVTGFLGSGKTVLLQLLLKNGELSGSLVMVNEFGETGLDQFLLPESESLIATLSSGCVCCQMRGDFVDELVRADVGACDQVILETTGVADPGPVFEALVAHPGLSARYRPGACICVVDLPRAMENLSDHPEMGRQIAFADKVLFSKFDLLDSTDAHHQLAQVELAVSSINPDAKQKVWHMQDVPEAGILKSSQEFVRPRFSGQSHSSAGLTYQSLVLRAHTPVPASRGHEFVDRLLSKFGRKLLRVKGLLYSVECPDRPILLQASGRIIHNAEMLEHWPDGFTRQTELTIIGTDLAPAVITKLFDAVIGAPGVDTPDADALRDNPLAIPGCSFQSGN